MYRFLGYLLGRHIVGSSNKAHRLSWSGIQDSTDTKVTKLVQTPLCFENIKTFYISMKNFPVMQMLEAQTNLCKDIDDLLLREISVWTILDSLFLLGDHVIKISIITVIHHYTQILLAIFFGGKNAMEPHNIGMKAAFK